MIESGEMPPLKYKVMPNHAAARLSDKDKAALIAGFRRCTPTSRRRSARAATEPYHRRMSAAPRPRPSLRAVALRVGLAALACSSSSRSSRTAATTTTRR